MPNVNEIKITSTEKSGATGDTLRPAYPEERGKMLENLLFAAIIGVVLTLLVLTFDAIRDNKLYERIIELERELASYKVENIKEFMEQQEKINNLINLKDKIVEEENILSCLKVKKYWQYEECF